MAGKGYRYRRPHSTCFTLIEWQAVAKTIVEGKRQIAPRSNGIVSFTFRRNGRKYTGRRRYMTFQEYQQWIRASSAGSFFNFMLKGNI